jgi:hypothetical protein
VLQPFVDEDLSWSRKLGDMRLNRRNEPYDNLVTAVTIQVDSRFKRDKLPEGAYWQTKEEQTEHEAKSYAQQTRVRGFVSSRGARIHIIASAEL